MLGDMLTERIEIALLLWALLYISDYYLTIWAARLYRMRASSHIAINGSLEITPYFREDIDSIRLFSPRFLRVLILSLLLLTFIWIISIRILGVPSLFRAVIGGFILLEATAHMRHVRNIAFMRRISTNEGLKGKIEYPRWLSLEIASVELIAFAVVFVIAFVLIHDWFFAGGVVACLLTGLLHLSWSHKERVGAVATGHGGTATNPGESSMSVDVTGSPLGQKEADGG